MCAHTLLGNLKEKNRRLSRKSFVLIVVTPLRTCCFFFQAYIKDKKNMIIDMFLPLVTAGRCKYVNKFKLILMCPLQRVFILGTKRITLEVYKNNNVPISISQ